MTHHLAHHLRPVAARAELPELHRSAVVDVVTRSGEPLVEYPTLTSAIVGHWRRLRDLGRPESTPVTTPATTPAVTTPAVTTPAVTTPAASPALGTPVEAA